MESITFNTAESKIIVNFYAQVGTETIQVGTTPIQVGTNRVEVTPADPENGVEAVYQDEPIYEEQPVVEDRPVYATELSTKEYADRQSYLADWPDRSADCDAMGWA